MAVWYQIIQLPGTSYASLPIDTYVNIHTKYKHKYICHKSMLKLINYIRQIIKYYCFQETNVVNAKCQKCKVTATQQK